MPDDAKRPEWLPELAEATRLFRSLAGLFATECDMPEGRLVPMVHRHPGQTRFTARAGMRAAVDRLGRAMASSSLDLEAQPLSAPVLASANAGFDLLAITWSELAGIGQFRLDHLGQLLDPAAPVVKFRDLPRPFPEGWYVEPRHLEVLATAADLMASAIPDDASPPKAVPDHLAGAGRRGQPIPVALVRFMEGRDSASFEDVKFHAHGDPAVEDNTVARMVSRTNELLVDAEADYRFSTAMRRVFRKEIPR